MEKISNEILFQGKWLTLCRTTYRNKNGEMVEWESIQRQRRAFSVIVMPLLVPSRRYVLIKQFRFAINGYLIGFPAGISYQNSDHALLELKEETGYTGRIIEQSPLLKASSGVIDENSRIVFVEIDENDPCNKNPTQTLEATEDIEVLLVPVREIRDFLLKEKDKNTAIGAGLWYIFFAGEWHSKVQGV